MKIFISISIILISFSSILHADEIQVEVKKVNKKKTKILVQTDSADGLTVGDILTLNEDCQLEVVKKGKTKVVLGSELCEDKSGLKKGKNLSLQSGEDDQAPKTDNSFSTSGEISHGVRAGVVKSFLTGDLSVNSTTIAIPSESDSIDNKIGLSLGYANVKVGNIGYMADLLFTIFNSDVSSIMFNGSGTWGFNKNIYAFGGLAIHQYLKGLDDFSLGFGFRIGAGYQFTKKFGAELSYLNVKNSFEIINLDTSFGNADVDFTISGVELKVHMTF